MTCSIAYPEANVKRLLKTLLERPFTYPEIRSDLDGYISNPPLAEDLKNYLAKLKTEEGESFLDHWRGQFEILLSDIAAR